MADWEGKRYELYEYDADNYDAFLKQLGSGLINRTLAKNSKPTIELSQNGDIYTLTTTETQPPISTVTNFELGKQLEEEAFGNRVVSIYTMPSTNTLEQKASGQNPYNITREFTPDECIATIQTDDITVVRKYTAV